MGLNNKAHYERMASIYLKSFQEWSDSADVSPSDSSRDRRQEYAKEALADLAKVVDQADREGITLSVSMDSLPVTRVKLKEEIRFLQERLEAESGAVDILSEQVKDLRAEVQRVNDACAEIDADWEASHIRVERVALISSLITFVVGIAFGMMI